MTNSLIKKHIVLLVLSSILFIGAAGGVWYFVSRLQQKKNAVIAARQQLTAYEENKKIFSEESEALEAIGSRVAALEAYRITTATTPALLSSLEALATKNGVEFSITTVQTPKVQNADPKLLIDFSAKGSATHVDAFLQDLSHQSYQIKFTKLSLFVDGTTNTVVGADLSAPSTKTKTALPSTEWQVSASIQVISF